MSEVKEIIEKPDVSERAISIYTINRAYWESRFYDEAYWAQYLDMLAENRFNALTLWNLHPFTFMIKPKNFPEASPFTDKEMKE